MGNERRFYVYAYLRTDKKPYYVGKGSGYRAYVRRGRTIRPPKDKSKIVFLRTGLTENEAFNWERFYIKHYGRIDTGTGILRNLTDGGEGTSNPCEEVRKKHRKNSKSREASKLKTQKSVEVTRMSDGAVFVYSCVSDASRDLNLRLGDLSNVCKGRQYSAGGFLARYWSPQVSDWGKGLFHQVEEIKRKQNARKRKIKLTRLCDGEDFIFEGLMEACRELNLLHGNLHSVCQGKRKKHRGYVASYLSDEVTRVKPT